MKSKWKEFDLGDVVCLIIDHRGLTPKKLGGEWASKGFRAFSAKNVKTGKIVQLDSVRYVSEEMYHRWMPEEVKFGDILITSEAPFGEVLQWNSNEKIVLSQRLFGVRVTPGFCSDFIYYYMTTDAFQGEMRSRATGTTVIGLRQPELLKCKVCCPDYKVQEKIANILRTIDLIIELNEHINDNLFQQLAALYDYFETTIESFSEVPLGSLCTFQEGYVNPAQTHPEYFDGEVKWLRAVDINESFIINTSRTLTRTGFMSAKKSAYLFPPDTIAISKSGTIGRLGIVADYMCGNRAVINIAPNDTRYLPFIYSYLKKQQPTFPDLAVGSVQKNLYVSLLEPLIVKFPDTNNLSSFCEVGNALLGLIKNNCTENIQLNALRDSLLPRLMSGELDVSDIDF